ncbi:MAG: Xaa-Pro dipeptidyl-peptidase [Planctomycetota bacterium]|nr:Xaa-Pro dipeptidyl-peptidase [Planctomycetota bacterium]
MNRFCIQSGSFLSLIVLLGIQFGSASVPALAAYQKQTRPSKPAQPVFKDGQAQVVDAFKDSRQWIQHDLWVESTFDSDGDGKLDRMHVDVTRQRQTDTEGLKVPVIYNSSPYFSGTGANDKKYFWDPRHEVGARPPMHETPPPIKHQDRRPMISGRQVDRWVPRGFAVVHSESPGTGRSQGCPTIGGDNESLGPKAVIDWLNGRARGFTTPDGDEQVVASWCTGKVGMIGTSYDGTIPLAAATTGVKGLEVIIPIAPNTSYYHYYRSNGLVRHPGGYIGEDIDVLYDWINSGYPERREYCDCNVRDKEMMEGFDRTTGDYNEFWAGRDYIHDLGPMRAALLMAHGFNDWNVMPEHSWRIYQAVRDKGLPAQIYYHQGGHGGEPPMEMLNRWFSRYLYGVKNGVERGPKAWIVRENDRRSEPTAYPEYPHPRARKVTLHPRSSDDGGGSLNLSGRGKQGVATLVDDVSLSGDQLARAEESEHRLLFTTPELTAPLHLSGIARLNITLSCSKPAANLSVWLVSLPWDESARKITSNLVTRGWADPQNHKSLTESEPLEPGKFYSLSFDLQPDDQIIPVGQSLGLMIFSSDRDFTLWPEAGTELTVDLDATSLELPVVGGRSSFRKAIKPARRRTSLSLPGEQY